MIDTHPPCAVEAEGLCKAYGRTIALDGFDLAVPTGSVQGLIGPNGAGKTTAIRILATLLRPDAGRATIDGYDLANQPAKVRTRIGLVGQHNAVDDLLTGRQNLELFGRLFHLGRRAARARAAELLDAFDLAEAADRPAGQYSGGMRRRLDLAAGMIARPAVLFLDEPTTGLDPRGRREVWDAVRALVRTGTTVLLTTQYLDEADQLADRITVVDGGRVVAEGTPDELGAVLGDDRLEVVVRHAADLERAAAIVGRIAARASGPDSRAGVEVDPDERRIAVPTADRIGALVEVVRTLAAEEVEVEDLVVRRPTLDEVFLRLTGVRHRTNAPDHPDQPDQPDHPDHPDHPDDQSRRDRTEARA